ncbi:MAG: hypothetical protein K2I44_09620 [Muribaculaceae bacterium]|nr:hypothetical protein [Muribaculaceae bacterium]
MGNFYKIKQWLKGLSFKTGIIVAGLCVVCYAISFAQMLLPISLEVKGALWVIFFGLAKTCQYSALLILGKAGTEKLKSYFSKQ